MVSFMSDFQNISGDILLDLRKGLPSSSAFFPLPVLAGMCSGRVEHVHAVLTHAIFAASAPYSRFPDRHFAGFPWVCALSIRGVKSGLGLAQALCGPCLLLACAQRDGASFWQSAKVQFTKCADTSRNIEQGAVKGARARLLCSCQLSLLNLLVGTQYL